MSVKIHKYTLLVSYLISSYSSSLSRGLNDALFQQHFAATAQTEASPARGGDDAVSASGALVDSGDIYGSRGARTQEQNTPAWELNGYLLS